MARRPRAQGGGPRGAQTVERPGPETPEEAEKEARQAEVQHQRDMAAGSNVQMATESTEAPTEWSGELSAPRKYQRDKAAEKEREKNSKPYIVAQDGVIMEGLRKNAGDEVYLPPEEAKNYMERGVPLTKVDDPEEPEGEAA